MLSRLPRLYIALLTLAITLALGVIDNKTGYAFHFFVFYFIPISLAAWYLDITAGIAFAIASTLIWFVAASLAGAEYATPFHAVWNSMVRLVAFVAIAFVVAKNKAVLEQEREISRQLRKALSEVKVLGALLPICAECKKIRDERGVWHPMEAYIAQRSNTQFSHGYCPHCYKQALKDAGFVEDADGQIKPYESPAAG